MRNGVVASLVVFMGLSGALGTTTFIGAKGASELKQEAAALKQQSSELQSQKSKTQSDFNTLKERLGYEAVESADELQQQMTKDLEEALGSVNLNTSYRDAVMTLGREYRAEIVQKSNYERMEGNAVSIAEQQKEMTDEQKSSLDKTVDDMKQSHTQTLASARASYDKLDSSYRSQTEQLKTLEDNTKSEIAQKKQETADFRETAENFQTINRSLAERVDVLANADFERADGAVVYADQALRTVRLNVGTKDGVRPLTTFNIFPASSLNMSTDRAKGSVQVVRALGEHMCEAKILEDEMSDPIREGDLIYTPLWRPGKTIKYALDYCLDINGDGLSDLDEVMNLILASGAEVAAYIDDEGNQQGEITEDVYRIVRADRNISDTLAHDPTRNEAAREKLQRLEIDFVKSAQQHDVGEIYLADFLKEVGYKETAKITRYNEKNGVDLQDNGIMPPTPTTNPVAPIYQLNPDKAPKSPGIVAPTFEKDAQPAPVSDGKVSDYYFRKRAAKSE